MGEERPLLLPETGFRIEGPVLVGVPELKPLTPQPQSSFVVEHTRERWYKQYFVDKDHSLYVGQSRALGPLVLALISETVVVDKNNKQLYTRAIVFTKRGRLTCHLPTVEKSQRNIDIFGQIAEACGLDAREFVDVLLVKPSARAKLSAEVEALERMETPERLIIGVVYGCGTQSRMDQMWANTQPSVQFERFLDSLGTEVDLRQQPDEELTRFAGFGGAAPDEPAVIRRTTHAGYEIIFHVSTLLQYSETDPQQLARKRKIGNDIGVLVFTESSEPFQPTLSSSKVNHVICVVRPERVEGDLALVSVGVAAKDEVPSFGPALKAANYSDPRVLRELVLTKLVNGMRAAFNHAPGFKREDTMGALLSDIRERYSSNAKFQSWSKTHKRKQRAVLLQRQALVEGLCAECQKPVTSENGINAMGKVYHTEHFACTHCKRPFNTDPYIVHPTTQAPYCEADYTDLFCPRCAHCNEHVDVFVRALGKAWHLAHFCCFECGRPIGDDTFFEHDGRAYCRQDFLAKFGEVCAKCSGVIEGHYIDFLGGKYHAECHVCGGCQKQLVGKSLVAFDKPFHPECLCCDECKTLLDPNVFFAIDEKPLCELHYHQRCGMLCQECGQPCSSGALCEVDDKRWHAEHFFCGYCRRVIPDGEAFGMVDEKPICVPCLEAANLA